MTDLVIETAGLRKVYGSKAVVQDLDLQVPRGEVFGFLGPNGAGKSTTVKMLLGLVRPTVGQVRLFGRPPGEPQVRARIGFLPEHFRFHEWLKASEFLAFHGRLYGLSTATLRQRIPELLELVGLADSAGARLSGFSKGMLQRIGLAQAMLNEPDLIFLDEPTSGLDPLGLRLVREVMRRLKNAGTTVFLNSHLLSEVEVTCDRVTFIKEGRVVQTDRMADLVQRTTEVVLRAEPLTAGLIEALKGLGNRVQTNGACLSMMIDSEEALPQIAEAVFQQGARLYELSPRQASLEEIFVRIIGESEGDGR
ncbi:MAG: ABC transporter ATP-binding protein [Anaerolineae bacterium]